MMDASQFVSLHQQPKTFTYIDSETGLTTEQTRIGFRDQRDLSDSIVVCGKENDQSCINDILNKSHYFYAGRSGGLSLFKIFIPPGSTALSLFAYITQSQTSTANKAIAIARFKRPPDTDLAYTPRNWSTLPNAPGLLGQATSRDYICRNSAGYLDIINDYSLKIATEEEAGWLYVAMRTISGSIVSFSCTNIVSVGTPDTPGTFLHWHQNASWGLDGDPIPSTKKAPVTYASLYQIPQKVLFTNTAGVSEAQMRTGYRDRCDIDDPILRCGKQAGDCSYPIVCVQHCQITDNAPQRYRLYIPPGATASKLKVLLEGQTPNCVAVSRLGTPPSGDYGNYIYRMTSQGLASLPTAGFTQRQLKTGDCVGRSLRESLTVVDGAMAVTCEAEGGWLYVMLLLMPGTIVKSINFSSNANTEAYLTWFRNAAWLSNGDPWEATSGIGSVVNVSPPSLDFGSVSLGAVSPPLGITLTNTSNSPVDVAITFPPGFSADWAGGVLTVGGTITVHVVFTPTENKSYSADPIKIKAEYQVYDMPVTGTAATGDSQTELQKLIDDLSKKLGAVGQAKKNIDGMIKKISDPVSGTGQMDCITSEQVTGAIAGNPSVMALVDFHKNKVPGTYGSYGLQGQIDRLTSMKSAMEKEEKFYVLALGVYNRIDKGLAIPAISDADLLSIGYDVAAGPLYNKDKDHPSSREKLESGVDLKMQDRPYDIDMPLKYALPALIDDSQIGGIVCLEGIQHIVSRNPVGGQLMYYPVGIQEPLNVCTDYDICHATCVIPDGGGGGT